MSEQNKSNLQALGAGLIGFAAVAVIGGGALFLHSKLTAHPASAPAAAPIDLEASAPRRAAPSVPFERREQSPAPLVGTDEAGVQAAPTEARAGSHAARASSPGVPAAAAAATAVAAAEGRKLEPTEHLTNAASTSAEARLKEADKEKAEKAKPAKAPHLVRKTASPAAPAGDGAAGSEAVASVHYGVKSRSELMGRAAGPVYNFKGAGSKGGTTAGAGKVAPVDAQLSDLKKQLENANLPPEQRAAVLKQLESAGSVDVEAAPK